MSGPNDDSGGDFGFESGLVVFVCIASCIVIGMLGGLWALFWRTV